MASPSPTRLVLQQLVGKLGDEAIRFEHDASDHRIVEKNRQTLLTQEGPAVPIVPSWDGMMQAAAS